MFRPTMVFGVGLILLLAASCSDPGSPTDAAPPIPTAELALAVSDGTVPGGNPHFFWLPPLAPNPSVGGETQLNLLPVVVVRVCSGEALCRSPVFDPSGPNPALAEFTDQAGTGGRLLQQLDQHYQVDWKTSETESGASLGGQTVRVWVLLGKAPLQDQLVIGFTDLTFAADGAQARGRSGDVLQEGRTLPLRFRLETGVAFGGECQDGDGRDCVEFTGSNDGFAECTDEEWACLEAEEGWLPDGFEGPVLIRIQQEFSVDDSCFDGLPIPQREACYRITTVPDFGGAEFNAPVYFGMCQEENLPDNFEIHQRTSLGELRRPEAGPVTLPGLECDTFDTFSMGVFSRLARSFREFVFGGPLYARDGFTATLIAFSEFFWGPSAEFAGVTAPATADLGETFEVELQLGLDHGASGDLGGIALEIDVDGGSLSGSFVSDLGGLVTVEWTVPTDPGDYELTATIPVFVAAEGLERSVTVNVEVGAPGPAVGSIEGFVTNVDDGQSVEGAFVSTPQLEPGFGASTNDDGFYELVGVPVGLQALQVALTGFESMIAFVEVPEDEFVFQPFGLWPSPASLGSDQENDPLPAAVAFSCGNTGQSIYQSFTPSQSPLAAVQLRLRRGGDFPTNGINSSINIRIGSPTGAIRASSTTFIPDGTGDFQGELHTFEISPAVVVESGALLVIEWLSPLPAGQNSTAILNWNGSESDPYQGGTAFGCGGDMVPDNDYNFRTFTFTSGQPIP